MSATPARSASSSSVALTSSSNAARGTSGTGTISPDTSASSSTNTGQSTNTSASACTTPGLSRRPLPLSCLDLASGSDSASAYAYGCRSPKRARSSPSRHNMDPDTDSLFLDPHDCDPPSDHHLSRPHHFGTPRHTFARTSAAPSPHHGGLPPPRPEFAPLHTPSAPALAVSLASPSAAPLHPSPFHTTAVSNQALSKSLSSPVDFRQSYAATSPARLPKDSGRNRGRREMSVPLLSQSLSSFSLSHSTPPVDSGLSPDAMTRAPSSSTPPSLTTPGSTVTDTPRRVPHLRSINTPAPLPRELTYPNTAPMPAIHSLLGSPFLAKSRPFMYDVTVTSPTWAARGAKGEPTLALEWQQAPAIPGWADKDKPQRSPTLPRVSRRGSRSSDDGTGSWTSASSFVSTSGRRVATTTRPSVVNIWGDDELAAGSDHSPTTPLRPLFGQVDLHASTRSAHVLGGEPPLKRAALGSPATPGGDSPVQPLRISRGVSVASDEQEPLRSPSDSVFSSRLQSSRKEGKRPVSCLLSDPYINSLIAMRRTSEPDSLDSGTSFSAFLARCNGERATKSELSPSRPNELTPVHPSSDANDLDLEFSPLRPQSKSTIPPLPPRAPGLPSSSSSSAPPFPTRHSDRRVLATPLPNKTPMRSYTTRMPQSARVRPALPRRSTAEAPQFHTPVSQLFGDDKPSPAAFASTGLVKKRGGNGAIPRFQDMMKARNWSPMRPADTPSKTESLVDVQSVQLDDWEEQLSPIKPLRSAPFSRNNSHARIPSTASEKRSGHARIPSTASSIGGSRGLRRKGSAMFASTGNISDSQSDNGSPATPTRTLPFAAVQAKLGISTPSPTTKTGQYPFDRRNSLDASPLATPLTKGKMGRVRALSSRGPILRASNPMLASSFRSQGSGVTPSTPVESSIEGYRSQLAGAPGSGPFERDYTLLASLGEGEFSQVWKVKHKETGELWAIKMGKAFTGSKNRQRQLEEVMILRKLAKGNHPHIIKFADSWEQAGRLYIRTELADCGDLSRYLASVSEIGGLGEGRVWKVLVELASALEFIHGLQILHLDLKPSNILLSNEGALKIADFGMSVFHSPDDDEMDGFGFPDALRNRDLEGDREYLCPEALLDAPPGPEADVYSLGILVLEAALNIALPSNGEAWVNLRNDDFSDIDEHYIERGKDDIIAIEATAPGDPPPALVSGILVHTLKRMMDSEPADRMSLAEVMALGPMVRARAAMAAGLEPQQRLSLVRKAKEKEGWRASPALVDEENGWVEYVLGDD